MALDEALMESVRAGGDPVLRFYRWSPPCLSLGRNQPAAGFYDEDALRRRGVEVVRRPTGGRAVLHDQELTYSAVFPERALGSPRRAYAAINGALVAGLRRLGVPARLQPPSPRRAPLPSLTPCFEQPAEGEVVVGGRKLIGSAQYRERGVILQHGSLLLSGDQRGISDLRVGGSAAAREAPAVLADHLSPLPTWDRLVHALTLGWCATIAGSLLPGPPAPGEVARARRLCHRYADLAWTWHK